MNTDFLVDTHCHLDFDRFSETLDDELVQWRRINISKFLVPGVSPQNWGKVLELAGRHPDVVYSAVGVHPWYIDDVHDRSMEELAHHILAHTRNSGVVAVGEIGLDLMCESPVERQEAHFLQQLALAAKADLPVIVHSRKAHDRVCYHLRRMQTPVRGVVHGFSGSLQQALTFIRHGFSIGVGGVITYKRAMKTRETIAKIPLSSIVLETDSPDMPPSGRQDQPNTPVSLWQIVGSLSEIRPESREELIRATTRNAIDLFSL